ncbi:MAG: Universal stress protein F [Chloroflexi bacterium]|nr:Universal stress protein F [Chloroflexota bacterium]MBT9165610.1 Universal stress protein F [Chloroflexota bacterium]
MYKKILAPLDGSELSERILKHVKAIATGCSVPEVILLRVAEPIRQSYEMGEDWRRAVENKAETAAREYLSQVAADLKQEGIAAETVVVRGQVAEEILDYVKNNQVDLVIMSTHSRSGISRWLLGSVADRVVHHCVAPVLVASPTAYR